ncbi:type IV toxin-antitoxin system AbiEi family antitoxin domain-containing protein [Noviherbaspirillum sedimenti]|uniref:type IV toxin-antitoxin system AbiEi family antitoxin domain-containing protein n=1 Tax=Noviherbaspirillum sedimenti TaxID=2320865 RepID=UPI0011C3F142
MRPDTHAHRLLDLLRQKGVLRSKELDDIGIPRVYLTRLTAKWPSGKAGRGL